MIDTEEELPQKEDRERRHQKPWRHDALEGVEPLEVTNQNEVGDQRHHPRNHHGRQIQEKELIAARKT